MEANPKSMSTADEYLRQADYCRRMYHQAKDHDSKVAWLELATDWLQLHAEVSGDGEGIKILKANPVQRPSGQQLVIGYRVAVGIRANCSPPFTAWSNM